MGHYIALVCAFIAGYFFHKSMEEHRNKNQQPVKHSAQKRKHKGIVEMEEKKS